MSDLIDKIKSSPTPKRQITDCYEQTERYKHIKYLRFLNVLKNAMFALAIVATAIFIGYNRYLYVKSFDNCLALLEQIEANTAILDQEINELSLAINGVEVDYE